MVSNLNTRKFASYTEGSLNYVPPNKLRLFPATIVGEATQYFSDRRFGFPQPPGQFQLTPYPFNPNQTDKVRVNISPINGKLTLTLLSWGNAQVSYDTQCANGLMYGFGSGKFGNDMIVVSLSKEYQSPIK